MNAWKLTNPNRLDKATEEIPAPAEGEVKVRVTQVLFSNVDAALYSGALKAPYPLVPGRFAVGRISSGEELLGAKKNDRVLLHTFLPERDTGVAKKDFSADEYGICGQTVNGYLRDFVCLDAESVSLLPEAVKDECALLTELVALAKQTIDVLDVQKGQHIAVFGGDTLGVVLCQLLIYQQAAPILIDNRTDRLNFAKKCGIYYTSPADDTLVDNVAKITGGRLADGAIFVTSAGPQNTALPFKVSARNTNTVYSGFFGRDITVDLNVALKKGISVHGVTGGTDCIPAAINLIATKALDFSLFEFHRFDVNSVAEVLSSLSTNDADSRVLHIAELI